jgi:hypothetical protein
VLAGSLEQCMQPPVRIRWPLGCKFLKLRADARILFRNTRLVALRRSRSPISLHAPRSLSSQVLIN